MRSGVGLLERVDGSGLFQCQADIVETVQQTVTLELVEFESDRTAIRPGDFHILEIDPYRKHCLMNGLDDIGLTMEKKASIDAYEAKAKTARAWA